MKPSDILRLDAEVKTNKADIQSNHTPIANLAEELSKTLNCNVSIGALKVIMIANGIETKGRTVRASMMQTLTKENTMLRDLLAVVVGHASEAPQDLVDRINVALSISESQVLAESVT